MKLKIVLCILLSFITMQLSAQNDSLYVKAKNNRWTITHTVIKGETLFTIARMYHVPPAILADANELSYESKLEEKTEVTVPVEGYNLLKKVDEHMEDARKLYHKVIPGESLALLSRLSSVPMRTMQEWNSIEGYKIEPGSIVFVGWVLYDATQIVKSEKAVQINDETKIKTTISKGGIVVKQDDLADDDTDIIVKNEPVVTDSVHEVSESEKMYMEQTANETNIATEKGPGVFFETAMRSQIYYAFYNGAPRNAIVKVHNPGNGKVIYVKVLGPLPATKLYHGSIIGISSLAKAELGVKDSKVWCELTHAEP